jgi:peptidoglycan/xylan/chitin deacetylase (PgdA/CDA1 family)
MLCRPLFTRCFDGVVNPAKLALARLFEATCLNSLLHRVQKALLSPFVRAINYHDVPLSQSGLFERQLQYYAEHFASVGSAELRDFQDGIWRSEKPGLIISFDDGLRSHAEVVGPLLEKYGFTGWFFVPLGFVETPPSQQAAFARSQRIHCLDDFSDGRLAMSLREMRQLAQRHVVGCHTHSHYRLASGANPEKISGEIKDAKHRLEGQLGCEVPVFCWVGGEEQSYSEEAARMIRESGYRYSFMTNNSVIRPSTDPLQLQRTNIEVDYPLWLTRFQLSGCMDLLYTGKRRRVNNLTGAGREGGF